MITWRDPYSCIDNIDNIINNNYVEIYNKYLKNIQNIIQVKSFHKKLTINIININNYYKYILYHELQY